MSSNRIDAMAEAQMNKLVCHGEEMKCKCGAILAEVIASDTKRRSRFKFAVTHKRDGTPIKNLSTKGAFLGVVEVGWCISCADYCAVLDTEDDPQIWSELPDFTAPQ